MSRKCLGGPDRKALAHKSEATRKGAAEKHLLCPFKAGGRRYKVAGRQNYTQRNRGTGSRGMWSERNLGRSASKAARLRGDGIQKANAT